MFIFITKLIKRLKKSKFFTQINILYSQFFVVFAQQNANLLKHHQFWLHTNKLFQQNYLRFDTLSLMKSFLKERQQIYLKHKEYSKQSHSNKKKENIFLHSKQKSTTLKMYKLKKSKMADHKKCSITQYQTTFDPAFFCLEGSCVNPELGNQNRNNKSIMSNSTTGNFRKLSKPTNARKFFMSKNTDIDNNKVNQSNQYKRAWSSVSSRIHIYVKPLDNRNFTVKGRGKFDRMATESFFTNYTQNSKTKLKKSVKFSSCRSNTMPEFSNPISNQFDKFWKQDVLPWKNQSDDFDVCQF